MATLYGVYRSRATRPVWLAAELDLDLEVVPVIQAYRLPEGATTPLNTRSPEFLAISPAGAVPVLKDGDLVLSESLAITLYLAKKHGGPLAPKDATEEAQMMQWALYGMTAIEPAALKAMYVVASGGGDTPEGKAELAQLTADLQRPLKALNTHLANSGGQMVGRRFTVADINMAEIVRYAAAHPGTLADFDAVRAWLAACQDRPGFKEMWAKRSAEPE